MKKSSRLKLYIGFAVLAGLGLVGLSLPLLADNQSPTQRPDFPRAQLTVERTDGQKVPFAIEVAATREQEEYGLMFLRTLPADAGMLFIVEPPRSMAMWMKNTYIPLDMLFIGPDNRIVKIVAHAVPEDLTTIESDVPVRGVVEINSGEAARRGLAVGDKVIYAGFGTGG